MNSTPSDSSRSDKNKISVPRDAKVDTAESSRREVMPSPDTVNMPDEGYAPGPKPLPSDSPLAAQLHEHPPQGEDQLEVGSAGDAARPSKTGIVNPTLPPRGQSR